MKRNVSAFAAGILVVCLLGLGALFLSSDGDGANVTSGNLAAAEASGMGSGSASLDMDATELRDSLRGTENVVSRRGEQVGYMDGSSAAVELAPGVTGQKVYAHDSGRLVGYMTYGDIGYVDLATAQDTQAMTTLANCYKAYHDYYWGGPDMPQECMPAFERQGVQIGLDRPEPGK